MQPSDERELRAHDAHFIDLKLRLCVSLKLNSTLAPCLDFPEKIALTLPTKAKVVGTFHVPLTKFSKELGCRGRHTECTCYFCRQRQP